MLRPLFPWLAIVALTACGSSTPAPGSAGDAGPSSDDGSSAGDDASIGDAAPIGSDAGGDAAIDAASGTRVRVMAANTTSGTNQSYEQPGIDLFLGLHPDVALVQEMNYAGGDRRALVDAAFGASFQFYVEPTGNIPNGVVSRWPILDAGVWTDASVTDRAFVWAHIDVPGPIDLWAVSLHLLTTGATQRATEAAQLVGYVQANVPAGDYLVVGGDLNTDARDEQAIGDLAAVVVTAPPYPADNAGNTDTSTNRNRPHDWLLADPDLQGRATPVTIGAQSFAAGLVFDSRVYAPLADVAPIAAGDSAASGMQHMPVVRDFVLPAP